MKLKLVVVDLELTRRQKRIRAGGLAVAVMLVAGAAWAEVPNTFVAQQTLTAGDLNENFGYVNGRLDALAEETLSVGAHANTASTIIGTADTVLVFSSEQYDTDNAYDVATGTFTAPVSGRYRACAFVFGPTQPWDAHETFSLSLYRDGSKVEDTAIAYRQASYQGGRLTVNGCSTLQLDAGDAIDFRAAQAESKAIDLEVASRCWV